MYFFNDLFLGQNIWITSMNVYTYDHFHNWGRSDITFSSPNHEFKLNSFQQIEWKNRKTKIFSLRYMNMQFHSVLGTSGLRTAPALRFRHIFLNIRSTMHTMNFWVKFVIVCLFQNPTWFIAVFKCRNVLLLLRHRKLNQIVYTHFWLKCVSFRYEISE